MRGLIVAATMLSVCMVGNCAEAVESCALTELASVPAKVLPIAGVTVPVKIAGADQNLLFDPQRAMSSVLGSYADKLKLQTLELPKGVSVIVEGKAATEEALLPDLQIGSVHGKNIWVLKLANEDLMDGAPVVGILGTGLLSQFDMELNLDGGKLNLFSQDHCAGAGVYWAKSFAATPLTVDRLGHLSFKMNLDGETLDVGFSTSRHRAAMRMVTATKVFGLSPTSPGMIPLPQVFGPPRYRYSFKALSFEGVTINNPQIDIFDDSSRAVCDGKTHRNLNDVSACYGEAQLDLGVNELRALRLYFAFKDKMLYVTGSDPKQWAALPVFPVTVKCGEPPMSGEFVPDGPEGFVTAKISFAINSTAPGALHVERGHDASCTIEVSKGAVVQSASFDIAPGPSTGELLKHVDVSQDGKPGTGPFTFTVKAKDETAGTLTLNFPVRYRVEN